jgi:hypothetical protein
VTEYADVAFKAELAPKFSYGCAVFLDTDRVNFQKEGFSKEELLAGLAQVLPKNVWQYVVQIPRLASLGTRYVLQGGTQYNLAAVKAQVDYIKERVPGAEVFVHPHTGEAGALGAAFETLRVVKRRGTRRSSASMRRSTSNTPRRTTTRRSVTSVRTSASARSSTRSARTARPAATSPASPARRAPSRARRRCSPRRRAQEDRQAVPEPRRLRGEARVPHFYEPSPDARRGHAREGRDGQEGLPRHPRVETTRPFLRSGAECRRSCAACASASRGC